MHNTDAPQHAKAVTPRAIRTFRRAIRQYYREEARKLPWRETADPYRILVSEIMLQQTQVDRVLEKYDRFLAAFPNMEALARASLAEVLAAWKGLGYNRRAMSLQRIARIVTDEHAGRLPDSAEQLVALPGIGPATAGAIAAFAYQQPAVFIETNIRRVFLHFFFPGENRVKDTQIQPLVRQTLDTRRPREWYYALMDYGVMLRSLEQNPNRRSAHYTRQARFENSDRQIRGRILAVLLATPRLAEEELVAALGTQTDRAKRIIGQLVAEGMLERLPGGLSISSG